VLSIDTVYSLNLAFIRYFLAVAETGSFTQAAERCHVTQPTLSAGIARLEQALEATLIRRDRRSELTDAGRRFLPLARGMVENWTAARGATRARPAPRLLRIGLGSTVPAGPALNWLAGAARRLPFDLEVADGPGPALEQRLQRGRLDLALVALRAAAPPELSEVLLREPYVLASAADHLLATRDRWAIAELPEAPFIYRAACEAHDEARRAFAAAGPTPRVALATADEERAGTAVLAGLGLCLMPLSLLRPGMAWAELRDLALERRLVLLWRAGLDPVALDALREAARATRWTSAATTARSTAFAR